MAAYRAMTPEDAGTFHVEMIELDGHAELGLVGELDMDSAKQLAAALEAVYEHGVDTLVLDLSQLRFIDSSGLNQLVLALKHQQRRDAEVVLRAPTAQTLRVLYSSGGWSAVSRVSPPSPRRLSATARVRSLLSVPDEPAEAPRAVPHRPRPEQQWSRARSPIRMSIEPSVLGGFHSRGSPLRAGSGERRQRDSRDEPRRCSCAPQAATMPRSTEIPEITQDV